MPEVFTESVETGLFIAAVTAGLLPLLAAVFLPGRRLLVVPVALRAVPDWGGRARRIASWSLIGSSVLLPGGFFLGGLFFYGADPGLGGFLMPVGGFLLVLGVGLTAWGVRSSGREES